MQRVGRYRLVRRLGHGGMAEVFEAIAEGADGFERRVALKRMLAGAHDDPSLARMFLDEARIASRLHHANLVGVLDYGTIDGSPFQVLELVDGLHAGELSRRAGGVPVQFALHVCSEVAHALDHAHRAKDTDARSLGIVHRDVSPSNVLVSWDGDVKLGDFGIAKARGRVEETEDGVTKGKVAFMSPEQAAAGSLDARSDVFSLGAVLVALITGESPLVGPGPLARFFRGEPVDLQESLPEDVRAIAARALSMDPADRYPSAAAMAEELGSAAAARLRGDARSALVAWLATLRPDAPRPGRFDGLLGLSLVLDDGAAAERTFHAEKETAFEREPTLPELPVSRRRWLAAPIALAVALAVGGIVYGASSSDATDPTPPPTPPVAALVDAGTDAGSAPEPPPPPIASVPDVPVERVARSVVRVPPVEREPDPARATGMLAVGGEGAAGAEIFVDGRGQGFAPRLLTVPVGAHRLELVRRDGTRVGPHSIEVTERHTRVSPARWLVP